VLERVLDAESDAQFESDSRLLTLAEPVDEGEALDEEDARAEKDGGREELGEIDTRVEGVSFTVTVDVGCELTERVSGFVGKADAVDACVLDICAEIDCENVDENDSELDGEFSALRVSIGVDVPCTDEDGVDRALEEVAADTVPCAVDEPSTVMEVVRDAIPLRVARGVMEADDSAVPDSFALAVAAPERVASADRVVNGVAESEICDESDAAKENDAVDDAVALIVVDADERGDIVKSAELEASADAIIDSVGRPLLALSALGEPALERDTAGDAVRDDDAHEVEIAEGVGIDANALLEDDALADEDAELDTDVEKESGIVDRADCEAETDPIAEYVAAVVYDDSGVIKAVDVAARDSVQQLVALAEKRSADDEERAEPEIDADGDCAAERAGDDEVRGEGEPLLVRNGLFESCADAELLLDEDALIESNADAQSFIERDGLFDMAADAVPVPERDGLFDVAAGAVPLLVTVGLIEFAAVTVLATESVFIAEGGADTEMLGVADGDPVADTDAAPLGENPGVPETDADADTDREIIAETDGDGDCGTDCETKIVPVNAGDADQLDRADVLDIAETLTLRDPDVEPPADVEALAVGLFVADDDGVDELDAVDDVDAD
jgi:hypothetical protein